MGAGLAGLLLASTLVQAFAALSPANLPRGDEEHPANRRGVDNLFIVSRGVKPSVVRLRLR